MRMNYNEASRIAEGLVESLEPFCDRVCIAGSIRRKKPENIKDIEIVCIPKKDFLPEKEENQTSLFGETVEETKIWQPIKGFKDWVNQYNRVKGHWDGKYTQRILPGGVVLDLFMATPETWGMVYAIRTGSADWFKKKVASRWVSMGYNSESNILYHRSKKHTPILIKEEEELFKLLHMPFINPEDREL